MAPILIALVAGVDDPMSTGICRGEFDFEVTGCQECRRPSADRGGVQVQPTVLFGWKNEPRARPEDLRVRRKREEDTSGSVCCAINLPGAAAFDLDAANGPGGAGAVRPD